MNPFAILLIVLTIALGAASLWLAVVDVRADRAHEQWMRRNDNRRRRTETAIQGIRYGRTGTGLNGQADHPGAIRKRTAP